MFDYPRVIVSARDAKWGMVDPGVMDFPAGRIDGMFMQSGNPLVDS